LLAESDRIYPKRPIVAVGALIYDESERKILLIKRANPPGRGKFSIPGGLVELGENIIDAVKREVREEVNIDCEVIGVISISNLVVRDREGNVRWHYVIIDFLVKPKSKSVKPQSDALEAVWVPIDEAMNLTLTSATRRLLEKFRAMLINKNIVKVDVENLIYS